MGERFCFSLCARVRARLLRRAHCNERFASAHWCTGATRRPPCSPKGARFSALPVDRPGSLSRSPKPLCCFLRRHSKVHAKIHAEYRQVQHMEAPKALRKRAKEVEDIAIKAKPSKLVGADDG